ncbi:hypothetical protein JOD29_001872 [Lysinibacillus composti]|uniref:hypothetical protein n=1 Tax=Lysinibacillus composti TaxID=720633 RepID=UPI001F021A1B|nr:hypothetical protein [Lysinibacillus composti]MBM7608625.1 hypothetical protein [Lysinibacillus composti]
MEIVTENLYFQNLDKRLAHLSQEQVVELIRKYYDGVKVNNLLKEYDIKINTSMFYTIFPPIMTDEKCNHCKGTVVIPWESKSKSTYINEKEKYCIQCGHTRTWYCQCQYCEEERKRARLEAEEEKRQLLERKKATLANLLDEKNWTLHEEQNLTLEDRLFLSVILRSSLSENTMFIEPLKHKAHLLAPTIEFQAEIVKTLTARKIIVPHQLSDINAFDIVFEDDDEKVRYSTYDVRYRINVKGIDNNYDAMIKRILYPDFSGDEDFKMFCYDMWKKLALKECIEYLLYQMQRVGYSFSPGEKTIRVFEYLLEHYSVAQIYGIIFSSVAKSTQRYQSGEITKKHAANLVITACEGYGQRAISQNWKLSNYSRIKDLPETYISQILYTTIMRIGELGFIEKPNPNF